MITCCRPRLPVPAVPAQLLAAGQDGQGGAAAEAEAGGGRGAQLGGEQQAHGERGGQSRGGHQRELCIAPLSSNEFCIAPLSSILSSTVLY